MHRSVNEIAYAEGAFLLGFPISSQNRHSMRVIVGLDFTGDNRRGAPQRSNQCGDCYSTQKSVHKSGDDNVPEDASPGTFYSALTNVDFEIQDGNPGTVGVRAHLCPALLFGAH